MDAVIYTRVSKLADGKSVQAQEKECRAWCESQGYPVRAVYCDDGVSASRFGKRERQAWVAAKEDLRQGDILVAWEASRAHRDLEQWITLRNLLEGLDVPLAYSGKILDLSRGDDRFMGGLDALLAEHESEKIRARVLRAKRASAAAGRPCTRAPWGYRIVRPGEWEQDPVQAPLVKEAARRFLDGESQYSILRWLQTTPATAPTSPTGLQRTIKNPAIAGLRVFRGEVVGDGTWKPIITKEQHYQLVAIFKRAKRVHGYASTPGPEPKHLLSGIAVCSECGEGVRWKNFKNRNPSYVCNTGHCCRVAHLMEREVEKAVFKRASVVDPADFQGDDPAAAEALAEIVDIEEKLEQWIEAAQKGEVTPAAFAKIEKGLRDRIATLKPRTAGKPRMTPLDIRRLEQNWPKLTMRQKRTIIKAFFRITVVPAPKRGGRDGKLVIEQI